eukprot:TRINITY_DN10443_c0_g5_i1.p1 TRINITY_DN10443_c0_g5~~TRINITY_DN10443_c0_g5_i1.p1  ORF type:complete len:114 (-),score=29.78 TRINITY_DN10443_c0_g5_i1:97-399(-)
MADSQPSSSQGGEAKNNQTDQISLKVVAQDGAEVLFKIKSTTQLKKLMEAYCSRQGIDPNSIRFLWEGQRLREEQTPKELGMEDNDVIDAVLMQTGGVRI